jgi:cytochrome c5
VSKHDSHFFNVFSVVLGLLVAFAVGVFAFSHYIGEHKQAANVLTDPLLQQSVEQRVSSPARVAVAGQDNSALIIAPVTTATTTATAVTLENGTDVYQNVCKVCHEAGLAGAPKTGDKAAWGPRIAQGKSTLYEHAVKGFTGKAGVMPAKGGRPDLSDDLIHQAVDHLLEL